LPYERFRLEKEGWINWKMRLLYWNGLMHLRTVFEDENVTEKWVRDRVAKTALAKCS
jgi:hypothetical protein